MPRPRPYKSTPYRSPYKAGSMPTGFKRPERPKPAPPSDIEVKFLDSELTTAALTTAWATYNPTGTGCTDSLSVPAQGDGESERDGRVYYIKSVHVKGFIKMVAAESDTGPTGPIYARVVLYWDTQTNAAEAVATSIMDAGGTEDFLAFRNLQQSKRFIVLKDKTIRVDPQIVNEGSANLFANGPQQIPFAFNKTFKKHIKVRCVGTAANVSSVSDNNLGIASILSVQTEVGNLPSINYQARIRFLG